MRWQRSLLIVRRLGARFKTGVSRSGQWDDTVLLPKTSFPMRSGASSREPLIAANCWSGLYHEQRSQREDGEFVLHDGPPFANGPAHIGHALNKVLKDIVTRYQILKGNRVSYVPGWDCHGLPIEILARKKVKFTKSATTTEKDVAVRMAARQYALEAIDVQKNEFIRWGILGDWENPYLTMAPEYEAEQLRVFYSMYKQGLIAQGFKPVYWSPSSRTALAEAELEYHDHKSQAVYVTFPISHPSPELKFALLAAGSKKVSALVWTTTPWTLLANQALAVNPKLGYSLIKLSMSLDDADNNCSRDGTELYVIATGLIDRVTDAIGQSVERVADLSVDALLKSAYRAPLGNTEADPRPILSARYVTDTTGTGIVHTAPAHGRDDFTTCAAAGIKIGEQYVTDAGKFDICAGPHLAGLPVLYEGNHAVLAMLRQNGTLVKHSEYEHRYPYDWRTKKPIVQRATQQWFVDIERICEDSKAAVNDIQMFPPSGRSRLTAMLDSRTEWCISRQRAWGVPIPVFYHKATREVLLNDETFEHLHKLVTKHGVNCWWEMTTEELLPPKYQVFDSKGECEWVKGTDTMDVWFDSGSSWAAVIDARAGKSVAADLYLEGSDQHRGWFQSSLLTKVAVERRPCSPFHALVTHGFVVDGNGKKMSKSLGNGLDPRTVIDGGNDKKQDPAYGADLMRWWIAGCDYTVDVPVSRELLASSFENFRKVRNGGRFILGNLGDFDLLRDGIAIEKMCEIDRFMLHRVAALTIDLDVAYGCYNFMQVQQQVMAFINSYLNSFYIDIVKDRLYLDTARGLSRRSAQTALHHILDVVARTVAPVACHLAEELNAFRKGIDPTKESGLRSIVLDGWPATSQWIDPKLAGSWEDIREIRRAVFGVVEDARKDGLVSTVADSVVTISGPPQVMAVLERLHQRKTHQEQVTSELEDCFGAAQVVLLREFESAQLTAGQMITSKVAIKLGWGQEERVTVSVSPTTFAKCPRCWRFCNTSEMDDLLMICGRCQTVI